MKLEINLQLFSGEKTEKATPKRRKEARDKGQVLKSKEINTAFVLLVVFVALKFLGSYIYTNIATFTKNMLFEIQYVDDFTIKTATALSINVIVKILQIFMPIAGIALVTGLACNYMQIGFLFTTKSLKFDLNKINPISGFKRLFSIRNVVEFFKSILKISLVGYVLFKYIIKEAVNFLNAIDMDVSQIGGYMFDRAVAIGIRGSVILLVLGFFDYFYQKWQFEKDLKMSKQEIKEEYKQMEGDPKIKGKIKERQRKMAMSRMMQEVPKADVIITNPTHYAIALLYDNEKQEAPMVIAKGKDLIAQNIKRIAKENEVITVENKPLARALYASVDIGEYIPPNLYQAVAEVLAYVYKIKNVN
ncbi:flagellar biosynthesis protein FlhB [Anaeromicrobium sediminis]|uniref:Flagellar biosynthetic protein FlhB n=1 Tax=Anaeromicrobium sediminis TaxID=1478221 RepID=A0A267MNS9_9FIRM|nr:flagellar biosynthesis protein FlhB [Anaeromicrobium sediminis]PAB61254.1 flagellar biosynthesis protein FlhB [Anaeromicrobium sediminis]